MLLFLHCFNIKTNKQFRFIFNTLYKNGKYSSSTVSSLNINILENKGKFPVNT